MPTCKKCSTHFKNKVVIDGIVRNLCSRSYCLICLPFKSKSRIKGEGLSARTIGHGHTMTCRGCGRKYGYSREQGHQIDKCNSCLSGVVRTRLKYKCVEYLGGACIRCGYDKCQDAMDFHHRDPAEKNFTIGGGAYTRKWDSLKLELDKCDLLCANCHRELHAAERVAVRSAATGQSSA